MGLWDVYTNINEKHGRSEVGQMSTSGGRTLIQMKISGRGGDDHLKPLTQPCYAVVSGDSRQTMMQRS